MVGLHPCTQLLPLWAVWVWWLAQSLICSRRRGHGNSDPKILSWFFFSLFFTMFLTTTRPQKTPTGMFLSLPNVHIFHIFTFTVYDILVGVWDLNICHVNQAAARVTAMSSRSFSVTCSIWQISSLILPTVQRKWSKSKPLGCTYVSPVRNLVPSEVTLH